MNTDPASLIKRRDALRLLASLPLDYCWLSASQAVLKRPIEEILTQCAAGITACWYLCRGKDLAFTAQTVASYVPTLQALASSAAQGQRRAAADLLAQCYLLQSELAIHLGNSHTWAIHYARQAEQQCEAAENLPMQIMTVIRQAVAHEFANHWKQALEAAQRAKHHIKTAEAKKLPIPPIVQSKVYAHLANYQGHSGQKQEVLYSLGLAQTRLAEQSPKGPAPVWAPNNQGALWLHGGLAHFHLGLYKEARVAFEKTSTNQEVMETTRIEALINQVMAEAYREDVPRDMDYCIDHWKQGIQAARAIQSEHWFNQSVQAFNVMRGVWPTESRIKDLREHIIHW